VNVKRLLPAAPSSILNLLLSARPFIVVGFYGDFSAIHEDAVASDEPAIATGGPSFDPAIRLLHPLAGGIEALGSDFPGEQQIAVLGFLGSDSAGDGFGVHARSIATFSRMSIILRERVVDARILGFHLRQILVGFLELLALGDCVSQARQISVSQKDILVRILDEVLHVADERGIGSVIEAAPKDRSIEDASVAMLLLPFLDPCVEIKGSSAEQAYSQAQHE